MPTRRKTRAPAKKTTTKKRSASTRKKSTRKPARRKPRKPARNKTTAIFLIVAIIAAAAVSYGIYRYTQVRREAIRRSCLHHHRDMTTYVLGLLFQEGFTRRSVAWRNHNGVTILSVRGGARAQQEVYGLLSEKLAHRYGNVRVRKGRHGGILISCGGRVTHRFVFIKRPVTAPYAEIKPKAKVPVQAPVPPAAATIKPSKKGKGVRVAIVIDDIGNDLPIARELLNLPVPITLSIFPLAPYSKEIAREALLKKHVILMHLPMEPEGYPGKGKDPGPGALYVKMRPDEIRKQLLADLELIPQVCGINNHMGSRFTCDAEGMKTVMEVLKEKGKIFLDSRTIAASVGYKIARQAGVPTAKRDVFLDNVRDVKRIREQLDRLIAIAKKRGTAIGIGHPHRATYLALKKAIPEYLKDGVKFVYITALVH